MLDNGAISTANADGQLFLGMDIGAVNVRMAVVDHSGQIVSLDSERIVKGPAAAVAALIKRLEEAVPAANIMGAGATGSGREIYDGQDGWQIFTSPYCAIAGLLWDSPDVKTIIALGGQSSIVIGLEGGMDKPWRVARSPLCAAGTGRFLEQQSSRLGILIEGFGPRALEWTKAPPRVAARCSVFAKSDLVHLQQKGWPVPAMLAGLSDSVARMIQSQWRDDFVPPVYFIGGVAANDGVIRALNSLVSQPIIVPANPAMREALGAALLTRESPARPVALYPHNDGESETYTISRRLAQTVSSNGWKPWDYNDKMEDVYLGVDVGSTSTKAAIIDAEGKVLVKNYLMTAGQPLEAVKELMANLVPLVEGKVRVRAVGVTGSGRYLVGNFIGADLIKNEITAQTRAALQTDRQINTIFELGGQDSKYVYLDNAVVLDYQMNKACAAGTGSFIDELAEQLSISTKTGEFADMAFAAETQLDLGERCAVFMSQAVTSAQHAGVSSEVIVSSLATSLAKNYLSKVVGGRRIGNRIYLTGAVFYNEAVVSAFQSEYPGKTFVVPEHKEVTGAIGAALLAKESLSPDSKSEFKGFSKVVEETYKLTNFNCNRCEHSCSISVMTTGAGQRLFYGSRCDLYDAASGPVKKGKVSPPPTPFTTREELLFEGYDPAIGTGVLVGVPRALLTYDLAPLFTGFLNALGVRVRYSSPTNKVLIEKSLEQAYSDSCFPVKLIHGHVAELLDEGAEFILIPNAIRMAKKDGEEDQRYSCPLVQGAPYIVDSVFGLGKRLLDPIIDFSMSDELVIRSFVDVAGRLGFSKKQGENAARQGLAKQKEFEVKLQEAGKQVIADLAANPDSLGVVLLSRAYNAQDAGANLGMANALHRLGVVPIPMDFLPLDTVDVKQISDRPYWNYERKILAASKLIAENPQIFGLFLSNFGCGPNSFIENIVEDIMGGKPLGHIEIDEHAAEAGYITRIEALVDTLRGYRRAGLHLAGDPAKYARRVR
ncbi:MAG: acyl-CoA dehydratase activase, partial [Dehalococcoidia bacterium]|nr:acyl-CoA dehydratase activase [Dehalococcoidia bacterium]